MHGHPSDGPLGFLTEPWSVNSYTVNHRRKGGSYGLVGTAEDYWRFAQMLLNDGELDGVRILNMTRDQLGPIQIEGASGEPTGLGFGLGFGVIKDPVATGSMSSEGTFFWEGAANTQFWVDPKEDMVVVAMVQDMGGAPGADVLRSQLRTLVYSALLD